MSDHPDIEKLLAEELTDEVKVHLDSCSVCSQIYEDSVTLNLQMTDLDSRVSIPKEIDLSVRENIKSRSKEIKKRLFRRNLVAALSAAAAVIAVTLILFNRTQNISYETADVNGDGEVNVLDSFLLARKMADGTASGIGDMNENGVTDEEDLKMVRYAVVNLGRGR